MEQISLQISRDLLIMPEGESGRCWLIMYSKEHRRLMRVPARIVSWRPDNRDSVLFEVSGIDMVNIEAWDG